MHDWMKKYGINVLEPRESEFVSFELKDNNNNGIKNRYVNFGFNTPVNTPPKLVNYLKELTERSAILTSLGFDVKKEFCNKRVNVDGRLLKIQKMPKLTSLKNKIVNCLIRSGWDVTVTNDRFYGINDPYGITDLCDLSYSLRLTAWADQ